MSDNNAGQTRLQIEAGVASILFDRPQARNAMTWAMYEQLMAICRQLQSDTRVRAVVFRGAGGDAFVAGSDIAQFQSFRSGTAGGDDGVAYEHRIDECMALLDSLTVPTVAVVEGWCAGGGMVIASRCDFRIATPSARFGVPIASTLGNCLSINNLAALTAVWGQQRVKRMLLLAEFIEASEAQTCGAVQEVCEPAVLEASVQRLVTRIASLAPLTQRAIKASLRRLRGHDLPDDHDLIRMVYGSEDFREGVSAFVGKRKPVWSGR